MVDVSRIQRARRHMKLFHTLVEAIVDIPNEALVDFGPAKELFATLEQSGEVVEHALGIVRSAFVKIAGPTHFVGSEGDAVTSKGRDQIVLKEIQHEIDGIV